MFWDEGVRAHKEHWMMLSFLKFKMAFCEKGNSESPRHGLSKRLFFPLALFLLATLSTLAQSSISVNVPPKPGGLTIGQTLAITATVINKKTLRKAVARRFRISFFAE